MNKHLLIAAAAMIAMPATMQAQGEGLKFGPKVGLTMANVIGDFDGGSSKIGAHVGASVNYGVGSGNFSILVEPTYNMLGSQVDFLNETTKLNLNYIQVPIIARYRFNFGMYLESGLNVGFLMGANVDGESEFDSVDDSGNAIKVKVKDSYNGSDMGWAGGIGYIHESGIGGGYRTNIGLKDITKDDDIGIISFVDLNVFGMVSVFYMLGWDD